MIAQDLEVTIHMAFVEARQQRHEYITVEHLLMALLDNASVSEVLKQLEADIQQLRVKVATYIKENSPAVPGEGEVDTQPTLGFQRVIQRAIMKVDRDNKERTGAGGDKLQVTGVHVLLSIFGEKESLAAYYLHQQGVTRRDVINYIDRGIRKSGVDILSVAYVKQESEKNVQGEGLYLIVVDRNLEALQHLDAIRTMIIKYIKENGLLRDIENGEDVGEFFRSLNMQFYTGELSVKI